MRICVPVSAKLAYGKQKGPHSEKSSRGQFATKLLIEGLLLENTWSSQCEHEHNII